MIHSLSVITLPLLPPFQKNVSVRQQCVAGCPFHNHIITKHHRILPCPPPSLISAATDQQPPQAAAERSTDHRQWHESIPKTKRRIDKKPRFLREKCLVALTRVNVRTNQPQALHETQHQQHHNQHANLNVSSFGGLKSRLTFSLFGLGKSADMERDKSLTTTTAQKQQQKQQHRRSSSAATAPPMVAATAQCRTVRQRNEKPKATAHANGTQAGTGITTKRISNAAQQLIMSCLDKSRGDLSGRVLSRAIHKRADFSTFCANLSAAEQWTIFSEQFHKYVMDVLGSLQNVEQVKASKA
ncbi:hypothetical protein niasHT_020055 [Heterodera trifolii]|uniref:Uncharacterized protein n=1 Tax=Heterodera trifolii TaxID=157864 RepID=A0ABD2KVI2_9BILA